MLRRHSFLGYQMAGSFSFAALFVYLSTVAFFLPDVFNVPTSLFGYAFALTLFGFMTGSLINARLVMRFGMNHTLKAGLAISLLCAGVIVAPLRECQRLHLCHGGTVLNFFPGGRTHLIKCLHGGHFALRA